MVEPAIRRPPALSIEHLILLTLVCGTLVFGAVYLLPFWESSGELSHGYFAALLSGWLLWRAHDGTDQPRETGPRAATRRGVVLVAGFSVATVLAVMAALAQGVRHSQTAFLVAVAIAFFLLVLGHGLASVTNPWMRWNGSSIAAAVLWIFAAPLPSGTLARLTLFLQDHLTGAALSTLRLLGHPAMRRGNVLEISGRFVGVEEACSGVISLVACLFSGVFLGGWLLRSAGARWALMFAAVALAVTGNFLRTMTLCLLVARGVSIEGAWHDWSGLGVLGLTTVGLLGICRLAELSQSTPPVPRPESGTIMAPAPRRIPWSAAVCTVLAILAVTLVWIRQIPPREPAIDPAVLAQILTYEAEGWERQPPTDLSIFARPLGTDLLFQQTYRRGSTRVTFYLAYWAPGQSTLGSVGVHTPDLCWPGAGWVSLSPPPAQPPYPYDHVRRYAFALGDYPQFIWFWHFFGGYPMAEPEGLWPWQLAPQLLSRPVSSRASQFVLRLSSNEPLEGLRDDSLVRTLIARIQQVGLG